jgi:hypothetical protein
MPAIVPKPRHQAAKQSDADAGSIRLMAEKATPLAAHATLNTSANLYFPQPYPFARRGVTRQH